MGPSACSITSEISQIGGPGLTDANDAAIYLVHFANQAALIDAGCGRATDRLLILDPCTVDVRLCDGDRVVLDDRSIEVIHIPGHSPGSLAYLVESEGRRVLFAQDVHGPLHSMLLSNRTDYQASLRKLKSLDADILCEGHHGVFVGRADIAAFIDRFIEG